MTTNNIEKALNKLHGLKSLIEEDQKAALRISSLESKRQSILDEMAQESPFIQAADNELPFLRKKRVEHARLIRDAEKESKQLGLSIDKATIKEQFGGALQKVKTQSVVFDEDAAYVWLWRMIATEDEPLGIEALKELVKVNKKGFERLLKRKGPLYGGYSLLNVIHFEDRVTMRLIKGKLAEWGEEEEVEEPDLDDKNLEEIAVAHNRYINGNMMLDDYRALRGFDPLPGNKGRVYLKKQSEFLDEPITD